MNCTTPPVPDLTIETVELQQRLLIAEAQASDATDRAILSEYRKQDNQDRWVTEIGRLREELRARPQLYADLRRAQDQILRLTAELNAARVLLSQSY